MKFSRFGGLSSVKQKHYTPDHKGNKRFHNPPKSRGFYAFVFGYEEPFLLGGGDEDRRAKGYGVYLKNEKNEKLFTKYDENREIVETNFNRSVLNSKSYYRWSIISEGECIMKEEIKGRNFFKYYGPRFKKNEDGTTTEFYCKPINRKVFDYYGEIWHHIIDEVKESDVIESSGSWIKTNINVFEKAFKKHTFNNRLSFCKGNPTMNCSGRKNGWVSYDELEVFIEHLN